LRIFFIQHHTLIRLPYICKHIVFRVWGDSAASFICEFTQGGLLTKQLLVQIIARTGVIFNKAVVKGCSFEFLPYFRYKTPGAILSQGLYMWASSKKEAATIRQQLGWCKINKQPSREKSRPTFSFAY
jgi:hypothetical protein